MDCQKKLELLLFVVFMSCSASCLWANSTLRLSPDEWLEISLFYSENYEMRRYEYYVGIWLASDGRRYVPNPYAEAEKNGIGCPNPSLVTFHVLNKGSYIKYQLSRTPTFVAIAKNGSIILLKMYELYSEASPQFRHLPQHSLEGAAF